MDAPETFDHYFKHLARAELLIEVDRYREALHELHQHLANYPSDYTALCQLALCHLNLKEFQQAFDFTKQAAEQAPDDDWVYRLQSAIFSENGERSRALEAARKAAEVSPGSPMTLQSLFWAEANAEYLDDAEKTLSALREAAPNEATTHESAGYLALQRQQYLDAEKHYLDALAINPESVDALNNLGVAYLSLAQAGKGRHYQKKSVEMFQRAVKAQPTFKLGQKNIENASEALKFGAPVGLIIFLVWGMLRFAGSSTQALLRERSFSPLTDSFLLTLANLVSILLVLGLVAVGICAIVPRTRSAVMYEVIKTRTWLASVGAFSALSSIYALGFWAFDAKGNSLSAAMFGVCLLILFWSVVNLVRLWIETRHSQ